MDSNQEYPGQPVLSQKFQKALEWANLTPEQYREIEADVPQDIHDPNWLLGHQVRMMAGVPDQILDSAPGAWTYRPQFYVKIALLHPDAKVPVYAKAGDSGFDLISLVDVTLKTGEITFIPLGIALEIPSGLEVQVRSRSGLACKLVTVANSPGTVDSGYRGEVAAIIYNANPTDYQFAKGDKIAQGVLVPVYKAVFVPCDFADLTPSDRGEGGFNSTGN